MTINITKKNQLQLNDTISHQSSLPDPLALNGVS